MDSELLETAAAELYCRHDNKNSTSPAVVVEPVPTIPGTIFNFFGHGEPGFGGCGCTTSCIIQHKKRVTGTLCHHGTTDDSLDEFSTSSDASSTTYPGSTTVSSFNNSLSSELSTSEDDCSQEMMPGVSLHYVISTVSQLDHCTA